MGGEVKSADIEVWQNELRVQDSQVHQTRYPLSCLRITSLLLRPAFGIMGPCLGTQNSTFLQTSKSYNLAPVILGFTAALLVGSTRASKRSLPSEAPDLSWALTIQVSNFLSSVHQWKLKQMIKSIGKYTTIYIEMLELLHQPDNIFHKQPVHNVEKSEQSLLQSSGPLP